MLKILTTAACAAALAGCASRAENIAASYASPVAYAPLNCQQIAAEASNVSARVAQLTQTQNQKAVGDAVATGVALVVFWPALFFISGDGATAGELGRLKGEALALESASRAKNCGIQFRPA